MKTPHNPLTLIWAIGTVALHMIGLHSRFRLVFVLSGGVNPEHPIAGGESSLEVKTHKSHVHVRLEKPVSTSLCLWHVEKSTFKIVKRASIFNVVQRTLKSLAAGSLIL
jgi:hypothetical protein